MIFKKENVNTFEIMLSINVSFPEVSKIDK